jgi:hypothetical protein
VGQKEKKKKVGGYVHRLDEISTSFFFTNFPGDLVWGDLWKLFSNYGSVCDVFIPKKLDKWGRKFGFVKFKNVSDVKKLSNDLEDVWWEKYKLRVNIARFRKDDQKEGVPYNGEPKQRSLSSNLQVNEELSFKNLLLRGEGGKVEGGRVVKEGLGGYEEVGRRKTRALTLGDVEPVELHVQQDTWRLLGQSKVGIFKETMDFQSFHDRLLLEGQHEVKAIYMGGNKVLLQSPCEGELNEVMKINKTWWDQCFVKIIPWQPKILSESRDIWLQIYGIPLHAWEENSLKRIAGRFGVFLDFDEATIAKHRLDVARVKLRTVRRGMIDTVLQLKLRGELFDVWVVEERCSCGEEGRFEEVEGYRSLQVNSDSGEQGWKGDENDLFSDGKSDSDVSESCHALLGRQPEGKLQYGVDTESNRGIENIDFDSQGMCDGNVGESLSATPIADGHVEEGGEELTQIPSSVVGVEACVVRGEGVGQDVENSNILPLVCVEMAERVGEDSQVLATGVGPVGPGPNWNSPFDAGVQPCSNLGQSIVECTQQLEDGVRIEDPLCLVTVERGGASNTVRFSQISEDSSDLPQEGGEHIQSRKSKKATQGPSRLPPPMLGIPKFRQLELSLKAAGARRQKEGVVKQHRPIDPPISEDPPVPIPSNHQARSFDLHVVLPMPSSGIHHVLDDDGGLIQQDNPDAARNGITKEKEAEILIEIQKEVGFSFEIEEEEIQSKLVELDNIDKMKKDEVVQQRGDQ